MSAKSDKTKSDENTQIKDAHGTLTMLHRPGRAWTEREVERLVTAHLGAVSRSPSKPFDLVLYGDFNPEDIERVLPGHGAETKHYDQRRTGKIVLFRPSLKKMKSA